MTRLRMVVSMVLCAAMVAACQPASPPVDRASEVRIAIAGDPLSLDPAQTANAFDGAILDLAYEQLTAIDANSPNGAVVGELAESWAFSDDGRTLTFRLRPDSKFDDGASVTADAVKASIERLRAVGQRAEQGLYWLGAVDAPDSATVRLTLKQTFPAAPAFLALPAFSVINPAAIAAHTVGGDGAKAWLGEHTAGSGSYRVASWSRGQRLTLEVNPHASHAPRQFQRVTFQITPNDSARRLLLEKGDVDYLAGLGAAASRGFDGIAGVKVVVAQSTADMRFLTMNTQRAPMSDVRLRQAVAAAIDYDALREKVLAGRVGPLAGFLPPGVPGGDPDRSPPKRDLARAKALLAEAGYDGREVQLMVAAYGPVAEFVQSQLVEAGFKVKLQRLAPSAIDAQRVTGDFDLFYDGWSMDVPDPVLFFNLAFSSRYVGSGVNASRFASPELDAELDAAMAETDPVRRAELYRAIEERLIEARPVAMLFSTWPIVAHRSDLAGVRVNPYQSSYLNIQDWTRTP